MTNVKSILNVALVQANLVWEDANKNRKNIEAELAKVEVNADIIILPEAFSTGFTMQASRFSEQMNGETIQWMKRVAIQYNCAVCGSLFVEEDDNFYNRFIWVNNEGQLLKYDKRHLFSMGQETDNYISGQQQLLIEYKGWTIFPQICYDLRFPVWSRNTFGYDLLLNVANWPAPRRKVWKTLLKARAIENQCYVVGVNRVGTDGNGISYSGDSRVIDFKGQVLNKLKNKAHVINSNLDLNALHQSRDKFNTLKDADDFEIRF